MIPDKFISEKVFRELLLGQEDINREKLDALIKFDIKETTRKRAAYFFHTNDLEKAGSLSRELENIGYTDIKFGPTAMDPQLYIVKGWTNEMVMFLNTVTVWSRLMCTLGYKHDCLFESWGTNAK